MKVQLSICIVAYNNYDDVAKAVSSLEEYTPSQIKKQVYIVDNSMSSKEQEENLAVLDSVIARYDDVCIINVGANLGFGKGHNYILDELESEYHAIVNPDIIFTEDVFSPIIEYMRNNRDVGMCIPNIIDEKGERLQVYRRELTVFDMFIRMFCKNLFPKRNAMHTLQDQDYTQPFQVPFGQGSFLVIRTELFKKLNGFDDRFFMYLEDADLCKRVNEISKLMYYPGASVVHRWEKGSHKNKKLLMYHIQSMRKYFEKWGYKWY